MSGQLSEGKMVTYAIEEIVKVFESSYELTDMAQHYQPGGGDLQRSNNQYWKPVQQQANDQDGWDLTGQEDGVLELSIQGSLGDPSNTYRKLRADDLRDETSYRRAVNADAMRLKGKMEARGIETARTRGAFCVTDANAIGNTAFTAWDALSLCSSRFEAAEMADDGLCCFFNPESYRQGGRDLVAGALNSPNFSNSKPDNAYDKADMGMNVAGFQSVYQHSKLARFAAQSASITVNGDQSFAPIASELSPSGSPVPFDNRFATIPTNEATTAVNIGDKFTFTGVNAISLDEKITLDYEQTFTVVAKEANSLTISPRPIALDDGTLSALEARYANIDTAITDTTALNWLNTTARQANVVMSKDAMVLASSPIPLNGDLFRNLNAKSFQVGPINGVIGFDGDLDTLEGSYRIAVWYQWNVEKPMQVGVVLDAQA